MREDWVETTLEEICNDGLFTDGDWVESKDQDPDGDYRLLQLADIGDGTFLNKSDRWMNEEQFRRLGCTELKVNDLLIARMPDPIGRACLLPEGLPASATVVDVAIVRTGDELLQRMLSLIVNSSEFRSEAFSLLTGTTRQRISRGNLSKISFWLPPLPEQKKIVDLIAAVDSYINALQKQLERATKSRKAVLHELLTAGGDDWNETSLGQIAEVIGGGTPSTSNKEYWDGDIVWLTPTEITSQDGKTVSDSLRKITPAGLKNSGAQMLPKGSVILSSRASVGFVALAGRDLCTNQGFQSLIPTQSVLSTFLMFWIQQNRSEFESRSAGSTFKEISKSNVKSIKLFLPPLSEQKRIVDIIQTIDDLAVQIELCISESKRLRSGLLSDLLNGQHEIPSSYDDVMSWA